MEKELLSLLLPEGLTELFEVDRLERKDAQIHLYSSQKNEPLTGHPPGRLLSKGFFDEITLSDVPLRGKACFLHLKRRKWVDKENGAVIFHDWSQVAEGTRLTTEFAAFLKGFD